MTKADKENELTDALKQKLERCREIIRRGGPAVVAFSGGVDSMLLLTLAAAALGADNVLAVLAVSPSLPRRELAEAREMARHAGVKLVEVQTDEMSDPRYAANPPQRCYFCKLHIFGSLWRVARDNGFEAVLCGANADDLADFRPGLQAGEEMNIANPLMESGLTKADIRIASRSMNLPTWNKPSMACLASRVPYGQPISAELFERIDRAENVLRDLGFASCRVRSHGSVARIEVEPDRFGDLMHLREQVCLQFSTIGYTYICLDLQGLRSGSMNDARTPACNPSCTPEKAG